MSWHSISFPFQKKGKPGVSALTRNLSKLSGGGNGLPAEDAGITPGIFGLMNTTATLALLLSPDAEPEAKKKRRMYAVADRTKPSWVAWGEHIRRTRQESFEEKKRLLKELADGKVPEPIRKARFESSVHHMNPADVRSAYRRRLSEAMKSTGKKSKRKDAIIESEQLDNVSLSNQEWLLLYEYWEHEWFTWARNSSLLLAIAALILFLLALTGDSWGVITESVVNSSDQPANFTTVDNSTNLTTLAEAYNTTNLFSTNFTTWTDDVNNTVPAAHDYTLITQGLVLTCNLTMTNQSTTQQKSCRFTLIENFLNSQLFVYLVSALSLGVVCSFLALGFHIRGLLSRRLTFKIYHLHSASEGYILSGILLSFALLLQPFTVRTDSQQTEFSLSTHYFFTLGAMTLLFTSGVMLSLDDFIHWWVNSSYECPLGGLKLTNCCRR